MMELKYYENDEVREMLEKWRADNFNPSYSTIARVIGITYTYLMDWKNETRDMGQETLNKIVNFVNEN